MLSKEQNSKNYWKVGATKKTLESVEMGRRFD